MLLRFGDSLRSSPLICNHEHLRGSPPDFDLPLSVPDNLSLTCKRLWEQKRNWCDHHCQQCWHLYAGCCCIWQQSHNYWKNHTPLILGDQHCFVFFKLYAIHLLKMLYSSNLSLCESSGKILECTLLLLWHYPSLNLPAWYIGGKTAIPVLVLPYEEYFTHSRVGDTAWLGLSEATQIPCEMLMALSVISNINARCCVTEWPREEIAWILISVQRVKWPGTLC